MSLDSIKDALLYYSDTESWPAAEPIVKRLLQSHSESDVIAEMAVLSDATQKHWKMATLEWRLKSVKPPQKPAREVASGVTAFGTEMARFCVKWAKIPRPWDEVMAKQFWSEREAIMQKHGQKDGEI